MIVMPSNNVGPIVRELFQVPPERIAQLMSPEGWRPPKHKYALDSGAFKQFNEKLYFRMIEKSKQYEPPIFLVCPDVVGCHDRTLALWNHYYPELKETGYPIAFVAQNGCTPETVPRKADWVFIGGLDPWKMENIEYFVGNCRPVHVGRVNTIDRLRYCESLGVASVDGTGWFRARGKQYNDFLNYFKGDPQLCLQF